MIVLTNSKGSTMNLPITMGWPQVDIQKRAEVNELALGGGVIAGRLTYTPRSFTLSGSLYIGDKVANNDFYDDLKKFLEFQPIEVDRGYNRHILGYVTSLSCNGMDDDAELELSIGMIAPNPLFYGVEVIHEVLGATGTVSDTIIAEGSVPADLKIHVEITSLTASSLSISIGEYDLAITGDYVQGDVLEIDTKNFTVELNGASIINSVGDDFLVYGMKLLPDENSVTITLTGTADVSFLYRPQWS